MTYVVADFSIPREAALLRAVAGLSELVAEAYCWHDKFETCGDPFCAEARQKRDAILAASGITLSEDDPSEGHISPTREEGT